MSTPSGKITALEKSNRARDVEICCLITSRLPNLERSESFTHDAIGEGKMKKHGSALLLAAIMGLSSHQGQAQTPVDVSRFDVAGIKLRMPISGVAAVFKRLQERDGGE